tara:strand:+ start:1513 stop:1689 length:177 start_codon:yes stop_codon:yes gene_type:complete
MKAKACGADVAPAKKRTMPKFNMGGMATKKKPAYGGGGMAMKKKPAYGYGGMAAKKTK